MISWKMLSSLEKICNNILSQYKLIGSSFDGNVTFENSESRPGKTTKIEITKDGMFLLWIKQYNTETSYWNCRNALTFHLLDPAITTNELDMLLQEKISK